MSDYIKREDAIKALEGWKISGELILEIVPSVDVVEVVRCKDCVSYSKAFDVDTGEPYWYCAEQFDSDIIDKDFFCAHGVKI